MNARSLVGMTMGARKRAARLSMFAPIFSSGRPDMRRLGLAMWAAGHGRVPKYADARAHYRIGERLRPCPGCEACGVRGYRCIPHFGDRTAYLLLTPGRRRLTLVRIDGSSDAAHPWYTRARCERFVADGRWRREPIPARCGGSGVLPARRR